MPLRHVSLAILICLIAAGSYVHAEDLGTIGPTYEITERDLIDVIKNKFRRMEKTGDLAKMQEDYKRHEVDP